MYYIILAVLALLLIFIVWIVAQDNRLYSRQNRITYAEHFRGKRDLLYPLPEDRKT